MRFSVLSNSTTAGSGSELWKGKPWVLPAAVVRSVFVFVVAILIVWVEFFTGTASDVIVGLSTVVWTAVVFLVIWLLSMVDLLVLRAANTYILRNDSLEVKHGIATLRLYVIAASGFTDLEVIQSITGRMLNYGDIVVRLQGDKAQRLVRVRDPMRVGELIRSVMARPVVRVEAGSVPPVERKL